MDAPADRRGGASGAVAVVAHGAGSSAAVAADLLPAAALGVDEVLGVEVPSGSVPDAVAALGEAAAEHRRGGRRVLVGGISLGAHAAALWAAAHPGGADGLLLVMPAWTGPPGAVAALTAAAADDVRRHGRAAVIDRLRADPATAGDWVVAALAEGWGTYPDDAALAAALGRAGASPGPTTAQLRAVAEPCAVVALDDDPLHPAAVVRAWAAALPRAALAVVPRHAVAEEPGALGRAAREALAAAVRRPAPCP